MSKVYQIITDRLIEMLEAGTVPWRKSWIGGLPVNYFSQRPYSGANLLLLESGEYVTWNQVRKYNFDMETKGSDKRAFVKEGAVSYPVIYFGVYDPSKTKKGRKEAALKKTKKPEEMTEEERERRLVLRYYRVFNIDDVEGLESKRVKFEHDPVEEAEKIISEYTEVPILHSDSRQAYYSPRRDIINVPDKSCFPDIAHYYSVMFHEMGHSTGHQDRLKRFEDGCGVGMFGSESYSFEELVAEIGSAFLCGICGIEQDTIENSAAYLNSWIQTFKNDNRMIIKAAGKAQKSVDYIVKAKPEEQETEISESESDRQGNTTEEIPA